MRAQKTLKDVDAIICENPKHSLKLLSKLGIKKKLFSLHDYNEKIIINKIEKYAPNSSFALISDAGSPLVSDPGYKLLQYFINKNLYITSIPGPTSIISALQTSGLPVDSFKFLGFLPKSKKKSEEFIMDIKYEKVTSIFFVSNKRLPSCLNFLNTIMGERSIAVCKEITKINEQVIRGFPKKIIEYIENDKKKLLGEFVVVVEGSGEENTNKIISRSAILQIDKLLQKYSLTDVVQIVHKLTNISKKAIYKQTLDRKK